MSTRPKNSDLVKIGQKSVKLGQKSDKLGQTRAYSVLLGPTRSNSANSVKIGQRVKIVIKREKNQEFQD